ncbi:MAG: hypothetical protein H6Q89_2144 [Myxococcaceae bacterium]|nr:hypothetical protein [Myxococcaceae bacterium]
MRSIKTWSLFAAAITLVAAACDNKPRSDRFYVASSAVLCLQPTILPYHATPVSSLFCQYFSAEASPCQGALQYVDDWADCWKIVDQCLTGQRCPVTPDQLAGRPLVDLSTGRIVTGGVQACLHTSTPPPTPTFPLGADICGGPDQHQLARCTTAGLQTTDCSFDAGKAAGGVQHICFESNGKAACWNGANCGTSWSGVAYGCASATAFCLLDLGRTGTCCRSGMECGAPAAPAVTCADQTGCLDGGYLFVDCTSGFQTPRIADCRRLGGSCVAGSATARSRCRLPKSACDAGVQSLPEWVECAP